MKVRQGFVSNSSSSSFVIFASKEVFEATLAECTEIEQKVAHLFLSDKPKIFLGRQILSYSYCSGNNGDWYYDQVNEVCYSSDDEDLDEDALHEFAFGGFESRVSTKAEEMNEGVLTDSQDW